ncbi:MAG: ATP-binding protein [Chthonomonadales bacterium]
MPPTNNQFAIAMERGTSCANRTDWAGACTEFKQATSLDATSAEARFQLGKSYYRWAETVKPSAADLAVGYGAKVFGFEAAAKERQKKFARHKRLLQESTFWLRAAIVIDPNHADSYAFLGLGLKELGYVAEAVAEIKKANSLQPSNVKIANILQDFTESAGGAYVDEAAPVQGRLTWNDLVLDAKTKRELRQMQLMLENPAAAKDLGVEAPSGILLKGSPGTGKTTIARVLAAEAKCKFFTITPADINQMYVGLSEQRVRDLFAKARASAPSIIFIDEIDALLPARQGGVAIHSDKVVNQFLQEMDGMKSNNRVFLVGATNRADMLDPAVRRGGRLSREIEIPLPDTDGRISLLKLFTKEVKLSDGVDLAEIAGRTEGYSGADLRAVVNEAGLQALIRIADTTDTERKLSPTDFLDALKNMDVY